MAQTAQQPALSDGRIKGFHATQDEAVELARRGIEPPSADGLIRRRPPPPEILELSEEDLADTVDVVCFVDTLPWTHERPLEQGERATVPRKVAQILHRNHQATILEKRTD